MRLAFNIEVREEKEYLLSEEDSKKVMDMAFNLQRKESIILTIILTIYLFM